ncbi:MAG: hypothetical protein GY841_13860, partial [FCB group bacterium]|nr:hypothetical protein [FCB group bacterium]
MFRPEHKILQIFIFIALFSISSSAYGYFDPDNIPDGAPANYQPIDSAYFAGGPAFAEYSPTELGGYYVFRDDQTGVWTLAGLIWPGGSFYEQIHGSVLVQMDRPPEAGVNVWPLGYEVSDNLMKNDRWGWVKYPDSIAPNLYEIWWDYTIDYARLENLDDPYDSIGISFLGCAFDFNIWATGHFGAFSAEQIKVGRDMIPLTDIPGFVDSYAGIEDQYQGTDNSWEANSSAFTSKDLPGATYNKNGLIETGDDYGDAFGGSRAYEGNGYQFSVLACPGDDENYPPEFDPPLGQTTTLSLCSNETITETIIAVDPDMGDIISLSIISGPGTLISTPSASPVAGYYTWTPTESGHFAVVYRAVDSHGLSVTDSLVYDITVNQAPEITCPQNQIEFLCAPERLCYQIEAFDSDDDDLTYMLMSGPGEIDPATGLLCFTAEKEGTYSFAVAVADQCDTVSCEFEVTIYMNQPPEVTLPDSIHFFCDPGNICLPLTAFDADGNIETIAVDTPAYLSTDR